MKEVFINYIEAGFVKQLH